MKKHVIILILNCILISGCTITKGIENEKVKNALELQESIINDPLFVKILRELEASGDIKWPEGGMKKVKEDLSNYSNNTEWLISKFHSSGIYENDSVFLWRKWNPFSKTVAVTTACINKTKLNKWKLGKKRTVQSILNTLIHERVHSFCYIHPESQKKKDNECDPSYIVGYLAEAIYLYRKEGIKMTKNICPALEVKIKEYNLNDRS